MCSNGHHFLLLQQWSLPIKKGEWLHIRTQVIRALFSDCVVFLTLPTNGWRSIRLIVNVHVLYCGFVSIHWRLVRLSIGLINDNAL
jgi:hypothetical protein